MKSIEIWTDTSDESMVGGEGWHKNDASASVEQFTGMVTAAVQHEYPGYAVTLHTTNHKNAVEINDDRNEGDDWKTIEADQDTIREIIANVWQTQDWYVESDVQDLSWWNEQGAQYAEDYTEVDDAWDAFRSTLIGEREREYLTANTNEDQDLNPCREAFGDGFLEALD